MEHAVMERRKKEEGKMKKPKHMKTISIKFLPAAAVLLSIFNPQLSTAFAQGSLAPPGAPAPTMKSLDQIEPRTPISSAPFTISVSGSYYLTTNVTVSSGNAITVSANNVTLDLSGFTISSTENPAAGGSGILLNAVMNTTIVNGFISSGVTNNGSGIYSGSGFGYGIYSSSAFSVNARVSGVSVSGCRIGGINLDNNNSLVESCTVNTVGSYGILAQSVSDSTALDCGSVCVHASAANNCVGYAFYSSGWGVVAITANNCYGVGAGSGFGVYATTANNCYGTSSSGKGLYAINANNGYGVSSTGTGLNAFRTATGCHGESTSGIGLDVYTGVATTCFGHNSTTGSSVPALKVYVANGCYGQNNSGTSEFTGNTGTDQRYNMP